MTEGYKIQAVLYRSLQHQQIPGLHPAATIRWFISRQPDQRPRSIVLKESFGNALVPFLLNHYEEVYVIDPRSLKADLPDFIQANGIQDVLIINYAFSVSEHINGWIGFEDIARRLTQLVRRPRRWKAVASISLIRFSWLTSLAPGIVIDRHDIGLRVLPAQFLDHALAGHMVGQAGKRLGTDDVGHAALDQLEHFSGQEPAFAAVIAQGQEFAWPGRPDG